MGISRSGPAMMRPSPTPACRHPTARRRPVRAFAASGRSLGGSPGHVLPRRPLRKAIISSNSASCWAV